MALIRNIFWIAFFVVATFAFIVLFEHGPTNFVDNAKREMNELPVIFGLQSKAGSKKAP
jgi:hypothetical protein